MIVWGHWRCSGCGKISTSFYSPVTHKRLTAGSLTGKPRQCPGRYQPIPPTPVEVRL